MNLTAFRFIREYTPAVFTACAHASAWFLAAKLILAVTAIIHTEPM